MTINEIYQYIRGYGLVLHRAYAKKVLTAIIQQFIIDGKALVLNTEEEGESYIMSLNQEPSQ